MRRFEAQESNGVAVQQLEVLVRTAIFKPASALVEALLQGAAYQPKPGQGYTDLRANHCVLGVEAGGPVVWLRLGRAMSLR
jgi:hypothetical protein